MYPNFDPTTILSDYTSTKAERRLFDRLSGTLCPKAVHSKPGLESSRRRNHHRQAYHQLIANCRNNQWIHAPYLQANDLDHSHFQHQADILPTTHNYASRGIIPAEWGLTSRKAKLPLDTQTTMSRPNLRPVLTISTHTLHRLKISTLSLLVLSH